ncbi:hypothetical protein FCH79_15560 [Pseudomonas koreensis]|nr:hypothetical protein [Pseudomonas koreensis]
MFTQYQGVHYSPVGASLFAKAVYQSTSSVNVRPHSRAGSLPHGIFGVSGLRDKSHWPVQCLPGPGQLNGKIRDGRNRDAALSR